MIEFQLVIKRSTRLSRKAELKKLNNLETMTYNPYPKNLPYLPGNVYADPTVTRHHKTQILGLTNGVITGKSSSVQ